MVPVNLGPQGVHRRALAQVEHPALDGAGVGGAAHLPAQGVDFPDKVALGRAADAGVAGAVAHGVQVDGKDNSRAPQPCGGQGGLYAGVPRADNGNIKGTSVVSHRNLQKEKIKGEANIKFSVFSSADSVGCWATFHWDVTALLQKACGGAGAQWAPFSAWSPLPRRSVMDAAHWAASPESADEKGAGPPRS